MIDTWNPAVLNETTQAIDSWNPAELNQVTTKVDSWNPAILNKNLESTTPVVFSATITASFPEGATCTATDGTTTLTADDNPMAFSIPNEGTWTVACVANGVTFSEDVVIDTDGQTETVDLTPVGETYTTTDSVPVLIACAGIGDSEITTIAGALTDVETLTAILESENAVDYLVRSTTFANDVTADSVAMTGIGAINYDADTLLSDSTWLTAICNSTYFESVLNIKVPTMTSNTTPSGIASATASGADREPYKAFDNNTSTYWNTGSGLGTLYYEFTDTISLCCFTYKGYAENNTANGVSIVDSSDTVLFTANLDNNNNVQKKVLSQAVSGLKFGLKVDSMYTVSNANAVEVQFYGRIDVE